jgi:phosphatidylglycerol---prolipoprotein diacylglyceryl transferase
MTYPVTLNIGEAHIHLHVFFEIIAYTIGFQYYLRVRKKSVDLISDDHRLWIFIGAAFGGFLGSHFWGIFEKPIPPQYFDEKNGLAGVLYFMGNKTVLGGYLGGLIGVEWMKKRSGITTSSGDLMTFPLILSLIIGRIGCHLEGLGDGTFGNPTTWWTGIDFGDGIARHPTNLYEIGFLIILWFSIIYVEKKRPLSNGTRFKIFLISYLIFRFFSEYLKPAYFYAIGLSSIQMAALGGLFYYAYLWVSHRAHRGHREKGY